MGGNMCSHVWMWAIANDMYILYRFTCFTLHSNPPLIACASVRSCAGPSILAGAAAGGYAITHQTFYTEAHNYVPSYIKR